MNQRKWKQMRQRLRFGGSEERLLVYNLYLTQALTLLIAVIVFLFQRNNPFHALAKPGQPSVFYWGIGLGLLVLVVDLLISKWVPEDVSDDGGINEMLFGARPVWHIAVLSAVVAFSEELLFRGAVQHAFGPYWTSIIFAAIHIRYLRHWLMTGMVFSISYGLGWVYLHTGSLWTPITAHFLIDFIMGCMIRFKQRSSL